MHCPRCGQQQASDQVKFCSRCGFLLELVSEILAYGGVLPRLAELENGDDRWLTRKNGLKFGVVWLIVMWFVIAPIAAIADIEELAALAGVLGFGGIILSLIVSFLFLDNKPRISAPKAGFRSDNLPKNLGGTNQQNALPPQQSTPASSYIPPQPGRWQTTSDLTQPSSVTEQTTKLLQEDEK